jgi:hypothetical protein
VHDVRRGTTRSRRRESIVVDDVLKYGNRSNACRRLVMRKMWNEEKKKREAKHD